MISTTVISHLRWLFPPLVPYGTTFSPAERWDNKAPRGNLPICDSIPPSALNFFIYFNLILYSQKFLLFCCSDNI